MKVGISTATFFGKELTENSIKMIKSFGVDDAEVFLTTFSEYEDSYTQELAKRKGDLEVYSVHTLNNHFEPELFNAVKRTRCDAEEWFKKALRGGERLGAKFYTMHGPNFLKVKQYKLDYNKVGKRLEELSKLANQNGINITLENVSWAYYSRPGFFKELMQVTDSIYGCCDIKQAMQAYRADNSILPTTELSETQMNQAFDFTIKYLDDMGDKLKNVHLCDYDKYGRLVAPSEGDFRFNDFIAKLKDMGYQDKLMIELYSNNYDSYSAIQNSVDYLKNIIEQN